MYHNNEKMYLHSVATSNEALNKIEFKKKYVRKTICRKCSELDLIG
jgi:hypothetical protein